MDPMIMRGRIEITRSNIPGYVLSSTFVPLDRPSRETTAPSLTRTHAHILSLPLSLSLCLGFDKITSAIRDSPGTPMDFPLFPQWGKEWGTVGVPAKERILRKIYYDSDEQSRKALRNVLGSMLICNCTYTSRSVSTDCFFTGLVVAGENRRVWRKYRSILFSTSVV